MKKNTPTIVLGILILLIIFSAGILYSHLKKNDDKMKVEGIVGSSLFKIWSNYNSILENETNMMTIEHINDTVVKLSVIEAYSDIVDRSVNTQLLTPISVDMKSITESIQKSFEDNKEFTALDQTKYVTLIKEITELLSLISKVYYVPASVEGAEVTLQINNKEDLTEFKNKLNDYVSNMKTSSNFKSGLTINLDSFHDQLSESNVPVLAALENNLASLVEHDNKRYRAGFVNKNLADSMEFYYSDQYQYCFTNIESIEQDLPYGNVHIRIIGQRLDVETGLIEDVKMLYAFRQNDQGEWMIHTID
ncbi:hypothetical protein [Candidatus Pristimantibacillus sp. PTI5]|uniref:hypothetical protein n=1 Tax=Candidatus Pristimantibacillus sp. PTI5 TaxID=3400422 RepID=UPI003B01F20B